MARTSEILTPEEILAIGELNSVANNTVFFKDNTGEIKGVALGAAGTVLKSQGATSDPIFGTGGGGTWGSITGTLSDQTDLQIALNLKANDSNVVHKTGAESIAGEKTFSDGVAFQKGGIFYGQTTPFPSVSGGYVALYKSTAYNVLRVLGYDGSAYQDLAVGALLGSTFPIIFKANGTIQMNMGSDATGDMYYRNASGVLVRLGIGTNGQVISSNGTVPGWTTPAGGLSWGASISAGSGVGLTMTSSDLSGANAFQSSIHTASGTLTACTTTQNTYATSRTYTLTSGSVTDNFIGTLFSRENVTTGAGGTLLAQGPVVKIQGTDTQTAGTLTPSYNLLELVPSLLSKGSALNLTVANSTVAPTNGFIYLLRGNTQSSVSQTMLKIALGSSAAINSRGIDLSGGSNNGNAGYSILLSITNTDGGSATSFANTGIAITNNSRTVTNLATSGNVPFGTGMSILQTASGTALAITANNSIASTNGFVNISLCNTQSSASVMQKIDLGSSAQSHVGVLVVGTNAATGANAFEARMGTGYTGDLFHGSLNSVDQFRVDYNGAITCASSITTGAPNTGTAAPWKLGTVVTGQVGLVLVTTQYVQLDINGTLYRLATV